MSLHYQRCTILLVAARKNALENVSVASLALHTQNFASATEKYDASKFTNRLNWTLRKVCKYKFSLSQIFPYKDRIQRHKWEKMYQKKPVYLHTLPRVTYFTY